MTKKHILLIALMLSGMTIANSQSNMVFDLGVSTPQKHGSGNVKLEGVRQDDGSVLFVKTNDGAIIDGDKVTSDGTVFDVEDQILEDEEPDTESGTYVSRVNPLYSAVVREDISEVKRLIESGFNVNLDLYEGNTALHLAASYGNTELFNFLVSQKGSLSALNKRKESPLHYACGYGTFEMLKTSKEALGDKFVENLNKEGVEKRNCLHYATMSSTDSRVIDLLMKSGMEINHIAKDGQTPTLYSINLSNWNSLRAILENDDSVLKVKAPENMITEDVMMAKMPVLTKLSFFKYFNDENQEKLDRLFYSINL